MTEQYKLRLHFTPSSPAVDIIAVQGLWAHSKYTWVKDGVSWLTDLLPLDIPQARIRSFGRIPSNVSDEFPVPYFLLKNWAMLCFILLTLGLISPYLRTEALLSAIAIGGLRAVLYLKKYLVQLRITPKTEIEDQALALLTELAKKADQDIPIILIGHSFGGLVIKQAIIFASTDARFHGVYRSLSGLLFLGTPHRGTRLASVSKWWWFQAPNDIRAVLELDSGILTKLDRDFFCVPWVGDIDNVNKIYCFYELLPTTYGPQFLHLVSLITVDKDSATWPDRPSRGLNVKHSYLVKFSSRDDPNYRCIVQVIGELIGSPKAVNIA